jgi:hypothetical protein
MALMPMFWGRVAMAGEQLAFGRRRVDGRGEKMLSWEEIAGEGTVCFSVGFLEG